MDFIEIFKKLSKLDEDRLYEMAIINPKLCKQSKIQVEVEQRNEGYIPHVHVFLDKTRNKKKCAYIQLNDAKYLSNHKSAYLGKHKDEFINIMTSIWDGYFYKNEITGEIRPANGYEAAVKIWVDTFEEGSIIDCGKFAIDENGNLIMPDYSLL